ncbi:maleylacetoacetate isomerase [Agrobacterium tumefaciens]|uniref:maleylacetoacetate isomerase n=1 Tax=Agrobacterium tumefaciens TaxID=358 RepID=UPI00157372C3|nr:maleylacetoacetate isomerase [Agrobacterium tumefaciens]NTA84148.1 maleylacetoacetate isomerase [Agrobacterium tumefaciens]
MIFHGYFRSSSAYRCRIAFNLKGLNPDFRSVHLRRDGGQQKSEAYRALNPQALVPALEVADTVLTQSLAIIEWLDETYPEPPLLPRDQGLRAKIRAFSQAIACDIHPLQNLRVLEYLKAELHQGQTELDRWCQRWIDDGLAACEALLQREERLGDFCYGETPSIADICLVPQIFSADRFNVDTSRYPILMSVYTACTALPAFADAQPSKQPDSEG